MTAFDDLTRMATGWQQLAMTNALTALVVGRACLTATGTMLQAGAEAPRTGARAARPPARVSTTAAGPALRRPPTTPPQARAPRSFGTASPMPATPWEWTQVWLQGFADAAPKPKPAAPAIGFGWPFDIWSALLPLAPQPATPQSADPMSLAPWIAQSMRMMTGGLPAMPLATPFPMPGLGGALPFPAFGAMMPMPGVGTPFPGFGGLPGGWPLPGFGGLPFAGFGGIPSWPMPPMGQSPFDLWLSAMRMWPGALPGLAPFLGRR